ncbi:MAG: SMC-Scp complex subunit ScpB [Xanthomonadales bacterium]|nr:SMC-Scp complex subunit ScpB [Xanthomonadales bacterium]
MDAERLKPLLEAALLAAPAPMTPVQLAELFDESVRPTLDQVGKALLALADDCAGRGIELAEVGSGFRFQVKAEVFPQIAALWTERQTRYSRALLETLALIAYRQPITRGEIEQIRGVAVATSILRTLEEREWVRVVGHRDVPGRPALYGTSRAFLDYFQLRSLDELPPLSALRDLDTIEPELGFDLPVSPSPESGAGSGADQGPDDGFRDDTTNDASAAGADARPDTDTDTDADADANAEADPEAEDGADAEPLPETDDGADADGDDADPAPPAGPARSTHAETRDAGPAGSA